MSERKSKNFESIILVELTLELENIDVRTQGYQKKHIWATCRYCGKPHQLRGCNFKKAGSACHEDCRIKEQKELGSPMSDPEVQKKARANRNKKYTDEQIKAKISQKRKEGQAKLEATCLEKYGVTNPFAAEEVKEKIKQTNLEKYGHVHPMQNEQIAQKSKDGFKETYDKYGDEIREKTEQTCLEKFGVKHHNQNPDIKKKANATFNQTVIEDEKDRYKLINLLRSDNFWQLMSEGKTLKELCEIFDLNYGSLTFRLLDKEFIDKYYSIYTFPSQQKQREVAEFIKSLGFSITENDRSVISPLELDIFIPSQKFAIEFNGSMWHSEMKLGEAAKGKHKHKTNLCISAGVNLVHIFEKQWDNRKSQWKSFLRSALGKNEIYVPARKCEVVNNQGADLIESNHLQGFSNNTKITFDLQYNSEIVGTMALGSHHRVNDNKILVLNRMAFKNNVTVQGGASKMFSATKKWAIQNGYSSIISWSDNAYSQGKVYVKLGFQLEDEMGVSYFYWDARRDRYLSKHSQQKSATNCPINMTEADFAQQNGLYRLWDCGKKRWKYSLSEPNN